MIIIIRLGFASMDNNEECKTIVGSPIYMAPEILN
jgi:serine/threonine protein kinase